MKTIYFDNAATSIYKPKCVKKALMVALKSSANAGRSGHKSSIKNGMLIYSAREKIAQHFGGINPQNVIFTKNCTEGLNIVILGLLKGKKGHVICTQFEHNSILRPLHELSRKGDIKLSIVKGKNFVTRLDIAKEIKDNTLLVCITAISNVTGYASDIKGIGRLCKEKGVPLLVDFAQGAGHIREDMIKDNVDYLSFSGHKGFMTPQGIGALCINSDILPMPIIYGGTGSESQNMLQPKYPPESLESGTLAYPLIMSLKAGIEYVEKSFDNHNKKLVTLVRYAHEKLGQIDGVKTYSNKNNKAGIVSFNIQGFDSNQVSDYLDSHYNIATRSGLHCAPLTHEYYNTTQSGIVRVSMSFKNNIHEINRLVRAIKTLIEKRSVAQKSTL